MRFAHQIIEVDDAWGQEGAAGVAEHIVGELCAALCGGDTGFEQPQVIRIVGAFAQQLEVAQHNGEQIVEIMGHAAGKLANGLHALGGGELGLQVFALALCGEAV